MVRLPAGNGAGRGAELLVLANLGNRDPSRAFRRDWAQNAGRPERAVTDDEANNLRRQLDRYRFIQRSVSDPTTRRTMYVLIAETEERLQEYAREKALAGE
jgi:hypothetical protein